MDTLDRVVKPKTKRAKRFLEKREPKLNENIKNAMLIKGGNANATVTKVLKDVYALKKPYGVLYKNPGISYSHPSVSVGDGFQKPPLIKIWEKYYKTF